MRVAVAVAAAVGSLGFGAEALAAPSSGVSLFCRVRVDDAVLAAGSPYVETNGVANPQPVRPTGSGSFQVDLADGVRLRLDVDTLNCRRDGGQVPQHGGANVADMTGDAHFSNDSGAGPLSFQMHVEDRGAGNETQDLLAIRVVDAEDNEVFLQANYLGSGDIVLVPTNGNFPFRVPA